MSPAEAALDRALNEQRKRLDALHRLHVFAATPDALRRAIEGCMYAQARLLDLARKL